MRKDLDLKYKQMIEEIKNSAGLCIEEITDNGKVVAYDEYWGREVEFVFPDIISFENLFEFNSAKINKEKFFTIVREFIDKELFMTIKKILFIEDQKDYQRLYKELRYDFINYEKEIGKFIFLDSIVVINLHAIKKCVSEDPILCIHFSEECNIGLWTTLIHELRHAHQNNPLYENDFVAMSPEQLEEDAEEYCRKEFEAMEHLNFKVWRI